MGCILVLVHWAVFRKALRLWADRGVVGVLDMVVDWGCHILQDAADKGWQQEREAAWEYFRTLERVSCMATVVCGGLAEAAWGDVGRVLVELVLVQAGRVRRMSTQSRSRLRTFHCA